MDIPLLPRVIRAFSVATGDTRRAEPTTLGGPAAAA